MNKSTAAAWLPLITALAEGNTLQYRPKGEDIEHSPFSRHKWTDRPDVNMRDSPDRYRVKPMAPRTVFGGKKITCVEVIKE